jgi:hypothetical protein
MSQTHIPAALRRLVREPLTAVGRVTVYLLRLNAPDRIEEREQLLAAGLMILPKE